MPKTALDAWLPFVCVTVSGAVALALLLGDWKALFAAVGAIAMVALVKLIGAAPNTD